MFVEYIRLLLAICLTLCALLVALNRHHVLLAAVSRLTDRASSARPHRRLRLRLPRRSRHVEFEPGAGGGDWVTGSGKRIERTGADDDLDWLEVDDDEWD
jgi:hypothetical protein